MSFPFPVTLSPPFPGTSSLPPPSTLSPSFPHFAPALVSSSLFFEAYPIHGKYVTVCLERCGGKMESGRGIPILRDLLIQLTRSFVSIVRDTDVEFWKFNRVVFSAMGKHRWDMTITRPRPTAEFVGKRRVTWRNWQFLVGRESRRFSYLSRTATFTSFGLVESPLQHFSPS